MPHDKTQKSKRVIRKNPFLPKKLPLSRRRAAVFLFLLSAIFLAVAGYRFTKLDRKCLVATRPMVANAQEAKTSQEFLARGDEEFDTGHCKEAVLSYTAALALDPSYAEAYNNRAYVYMRQQNYGPALQDLDQALRLRPNYIHALMNRADIHNYYFAKDARKALADYDKILSLGDSSSSVCGHRAVALLEVPGREGWNLLSYLQLLKKTPEELCAIHE